MTTVYKFKAYFTDAGVGTAQDPAPTCTVINMADDSKLADAQATTASTNMPGLYSYEYSGNDGLDCVAVFITTDTGCDVKQLASYVSEKITTNLNADIAGVETKLDTVDANVDSILADTGTDGVVIASAQTVATVTDVTNAVKISAGTGAGQLDFTSGVVKSNLSQILGTALTETAGQIAAAFKKFFNVATPTGTVNSLPDAVAGANGGLPTTNGTKVTQTVDLTAGQSIAANGGTVATVTNLTNLPTMPNDWVTAAGLKADAVTKLQANLALEATLTAIKGAGWSDQTLVAIDILIDAIKAKTDLIPATPAEVGSAMTLTAAYDKAKDDVLTPLATVDGIVDAIKAKTDNIPANPAPANEYDARMTAIQADLDNPAQYKADVSGLPTAGEIADSVWDEETSGHATATTFGGKNQKVVPSETINDYKADVSALTNVTLSAAGVDAILDEVVVGTYTMRQLLKLFGAKLHGTAAGGNTDTITYDSLDGTTTSVIVETVDENGNRTVVLTV